MSDPARHLRTDPITDDDDTIAEALEALSVPVLMASIVHLTGDPMILRGPIRPREFVMNEFQGKLTDVEKATLRATAYDAIRAWRDAGCPPPEPLGTDLIREIMDWIACEPVPDDYAALYLEEMDLGAQSPRSIRVTENAAAAATDYSVLVIGCGEAGLLAGIRCKEAGIPFEIIEKNDDVGGTWFENTYPGCRVDVASHYYSFSFESVSSFDEYYTRQPELYRYFRRLLEDHRIGDHVRWGSEVERAVWDEPSQQWTVSVRGPDGVVATRSADVLISGVGILNRPHVPDLPGLDRFGGPAFHSARWDSSAEVTGKRVALIGAGASGFQIGPAIVDEVAQLTVFQRTPQWMAPNPRYHAAVQPGEQWAMAHLPGYSRWFRFWLMWQSSDKLLEMVRMDPGWEGFPQTANALSAARRELFQAWIDKHVGDDPELLAKVSPKYPPMAKRMLQDNGSWLRCLTRDHVELDTTAILDIDETSITTASGRYEVDVIVLATGFLPNEVLFPMDIIGRDGVSIADTWAGRPAGYHGVTVPGFPNFFMLNGPGTGLAHAGSVILMTECSMRYVTEALQALIEGGHRTIEPTPAAHRRYFDALQAEVATLMWGHPSIEHSWYKAADGNVYVLCPWRLVDYWNMTRTLDRDDHVLT